MLKRVLWTALIVCASMSAASAQWIASTKGGAFDDKPLHIALTAIRGGYALGLRCRDSHSMEMVYITGETADDGIEAMNSLSPKIRFRPDKGDIIDLAAAVESIDGKLVVVADVGTEIFKSVKEAKSSVAVVVTVMEQNFHENSFGVRGSTAAIEKISSGCDLSRE